MQGRCHPPVELLPLRRAHIRVGVVARALSREGVECLNVVRQRRERVDLRRGGVRLALLAALERSAGVAAVLIDDEGGFVAAGVTMAAPPLFG